MRGPAGSLLPAALVASLLLSACDSWPWKRTAALGEEGYAGAATVNDYAETIDAYGVQGTGVGENRMAPGEDRADLFAYASSLRSLGREQLDEEYRRVNGRLARAPNGGDQLRLAILLMEPRASFRDLERARGILEDYLADSWAGEAVPRYHDVALFLLRYSEQIQQASVVETGMSRQLDAERSRRESLARRVESLQAELERLRAERVKLEEQVEALKNIEETLRTRDQAGEERLKR